MALSAFQQAFKDARANGETEFEFNGKKYNTKYKEEVSAPNKKETSQPMQDASKMGGAAVGSQKTLPVDNSPKQASGENKSWWTTPNKNLQEGKLPSGKEIREALGSSYKKGGSVSSASRRADGCAQRGKTRGKMV